MLENGGSENKDTGPRRKGCDPLAQTVRGKLQNRRQKLNGQINKEMRMRAGAENLFRAASNRKIKEQVAMELSFVNSNLQLLKEELAEINSEVEAYQNDTLLRSVPLIPLGLKETKEIDVKLVFQDYILEHYSEDGADYEQEIQEFMELRQAMRTPKRTSEGVDLLFEYYNQLYFVENRFFPPDRHTSIYLTWYDALTGIPSVQRSIAFEKGSVLFNICSLYTQIGARQDRSTPEGIQEAITNLQLAAGGFRYLAANFSHAPSMDMSKPVLLMLDALMMGQVQECIFERRVLGGVAENVQTSFEVAQEAAVVSEAYSKVHQLMMHPKVKDYIPYSWISMVLVKSQHFKASSHYYAAMGYTDKESTYDQATLEQVFPTVYDEHRSLQVPRSQQERKRLSKAHIRQALMLHEEALRVHNLSKMLRKIDTLQEVLRQSHDRSMSCYTELDEEDDFFEMMDVPDIKGETELVLEPTAIDFTRVKVNDIFHKLGPLAIFNAGNNWSAPRMVDIQRGAEGFGFTVRGDSPVIIASVDRGYVASASGVKEGDFIVGVNGQIVKWSKHGEVVKQILSSQRLRIELVTPLGSEILHPQDKRRLNSSDSAGSSQTDMNGSVISGSSTKDRRQPSPKKSARDVPDGSRSLGRGKSPSRTKSPGRAKGPETVNHLGSKSLPRGATVNGNGSTGTGKKKERGNKGKASSSQKEGAKKARGVLNSKAGLW
ncbi:rhophilin-1-like [Acanthaster planci]|uniref:Rhophilin-1-like n=1 Tax=Acanthaster planci TaxID=133434 RepID=A0A8B7YS47_ACAPL|nr:rhophilin-1-like [Acanthaster planci]